MFFVCVHSVSIYIYMRLVITLLVKTSTIFPTISNDRTRQFNRLLMRDSMEHINTNGLTFYDQVQMFS